ncbi:peptidoglycan DD-metalloendopeptidase family protein [Octadecabacter sp. R77987]|uniref:peptidoglycan DD-metalloendopeptidase family protein n=1 Tax=Octadecabacter sp. R77987 TaxID=3093874 RepID=UPI003673230A
MATFTPRPLTSKAKLMLAGCAIALVAACDADGNFDIDLRDLGGGGLDTSAAAQNITARPRPDDRGVISYPNYQVVVAERGETARMVADRLGLNAEELASYNGINPDVPLRRDEIIALPNRVAEPSPATGAVMTGPIQPSAIDVTTLAGAAIDRAGPQEPVAQPATTPAPQTGSEPIRHRVARGETAYSIARLYDVPVRSLSDWNGLGADLALREGQFVLIPVAGATPPATTPMVEEPGTGSATPVPPSAAEPLPDDDTTAAAAPVVAPPAPDLGERTTTPATSAPFIYPVQGSIIREYARGRNEGIDIGVPAGTPVKAAAAGTVAAVTTDTNGIAIVVIKHTGNILTVYTNLDGLRVSKDDSVTQGQTIATVREGSPSFVHFEVRDGLESVDPTDYLP